VNQFTMFTWRAATPKIGGGVEGDVPAAGRDVDPCDCPIGRAALEPLAYCGFFKSCHRSALDKIAAL